MSVPHDPVTTGLTNRQQASANLKRLKKLATLYWSLRQSPVYEDRLEYDQAELMISYPQLTHIEARLLYIMLQELP